MTARFLPIHLALIALWLVPACLSAQGSSSNRAAETRALVQRLVLDRAAAVASVQRIADDREEQLFAELTAKDRRLRAEQRTRKQAQTELAAVTAQRQRLMAKIAGRDRWFAAEIEEYGEQIAAIADSPDPRKREALKRYAEGDRAGGFDALVAIQKAETKAVAAGWREIAALAQDRKDHGEMGTAEVISLYEAAQSLDADFSWGWVELRRLYQEAGRLPDARRAAEQALAHAHSLRDQAAAELELGDVLVAMRDLSAAREQFEQNLKLAEQLAQANPGREATQRDLGVSLNKLGDVLVATGDPAGARERFEQSLKIREQLAKADPDSEPAQRDLSASFSRLGSVLAITGNLAAARERLEQSFNIAEHLAKANPDSADAQRDLSFSLTKLGNMLVAAGDLAGARERFEQSLKIYKHLAKANPDNAEDQRDLILAHAKLGHLPGGESHLTEALRIALALQSQGRLAPRDAWMIDDLRKHVADTEKAEP